MNHLWLATLLVSVIGFARAAAAKEGMAASLGLFYFSEDVSHPPIADDSTQEKSESSTTYTMLNIGLCYVVKSVCLGLKYVDLSILTKTRTENTFGTRVDQVPAAYKGGGATVGYYEDFTLSLSYFFDAKKTNDQTTTIFDSVSTATEEYPAKSAYMIEAGYGFALGSFRAGPLISRYSFAYNRRIRNGESTVLATTYTESYIIPQFALWMDF